MPVSISRHGEAKEHNQHHNKKRVALLWLLWLLWLLCGCVVVWLLCVVVVVVVVARGLFFAMLQYSSLCEGAAVLTLGVVEIGDGVPGRVQVECGMEEINKGEKQEKDRMRTNNAQTHIMDGMKME